MENGFSRIGVSHENKIPKKIKIPEWEMDFSVARSSGPGGQNVNKTSTKVIIHFNIDASKSLSSEEKNRITKELKNSINKEGYIVVSEQSNRSQWSNRVNAIKKLNNMINEALVEDKERVATKPTKGSKEKRITEKKARANVKKMRSRVTGY